MAAGVGDGRFVVEVMTCSGPCRAVGPAGSAPAGVIETLALATGIRIAVRGDELVGIDGAALIAWQWLRTGGLAEGLEISVPIGLDKALARGDRQR